MSEPRRYRAVIVRKGRCLEDGYTEPYARIEEGPHDGDVMPMGWNIYGPTLEVGTVGVCEYVSTPAAGLWRFTATVGVQGQPLLRPTLAETVESEYPHRWEDAS